jgi:hypothetical protein
MDWQTQLDSMAKRILRAVLKSKGHACPPQLLLLKTPSNDQLLNNHVFIPQKIDSNVNIPSLQTVFHRMYVLNILLSIQHKEIKENQFHPLSWQMLFWTGLNLFYF